MYKLNQKSICFSLTKFPNFADGSGAGGQSGGYLSHKVCFDEGILSREDWSGRTTFRSQNWSGCRNSSLPCKGLI